MPPSRIEVTAIVLLLLASSLAQSASVSSITLTVVTSFGEPLPGGEVLIEGQGIQKGLVIKGRTTVVLPYGTYHITSKATAYYWGFERMVDVITPKAFALIVLTPKETYAINGEGTFTPYTVSGDVKLGQRPSNRLYIRLRGLYLPDSAESDVGERGHFELAVKRQGSYSIELVDGESILCTKTIRLDESTERPLKVDLIVPGSGG